MDNKDIWKRENSVTKVANHFNQDSEEEIIAIKKLLEEEDLDIMLIREQGHREVKQAFRQNPGPDLFRITEKQKNLELIQSTKDMITT